MSRLIYTLLIFVVVATVGLGWMFDWLYQQNTSPPHDVDKVKLMEELGGQLSHALNLTAEPELFIAHWQVGQENEQNLYRSVQLELIAQEDQPMPQSLQQQLIQGNSVLLETSDSLRWHYYLPLKKAYLIISLSKEPFSPPEMSSRYAFTIAFYTLLLTTFLVWLYPLIRQLLRLRKTAKAIGEGQLEQRIPESRVSYIPEIEYEFNRMAQRIEDLVADVKLLSSAVSHDLRTPLARIQFGLDTLAEEDDAQLRDTYHKRVSLHIEQMSSLIETLLTYARLDQSIDAMELTVVDTNALMSKLIKVSELSARVALNLSMPEQTSSIKANETYLSILVNNLLENACKYGGGKVDVIVQNEKSNWVLSIHDNGEGISEQDRENVVKPFIRGKQESSTVRGHGIGLAMVKRIVEGLHGKLMITDSNRLTGACITVMLPAQVSRSA